MHVLVPVLFVVVMMFLVDGMTNPGSLENEHHQEAR